MKIIKRIIEDVKENTPSSYLDVTSQNLFEFPANVDGKPVKRLFMLLPSKGCEWAMQKGGGCAPCGALYYTSKDKEIPKEFILNKFKESYHNIDWKNYPVVYLCTGGSFLSDKEVPWDVKANILRIIEGNKDIKKVIVESLPNLVTHKKIRNLKSLLKSKRIEIGIGLDSFDDYIRLNCINKNFSHKQYDKAAKIIKREGLSLLTYVHIKPPFLTEKEAIDDAIKTVNYAFKKNTRAVSLEPIFVMKHTLVDFLYQKGRYKPPWLWSVLEVLKKSVSSSREIRINQNENFETTTGYPQNYCEKDCSLNIRKKIFEYNKNLDVSIFDDISCECRNKWEEECKIISPYSLEKRIKLSLEDYNG